MLMNELRIKVKVMINALKYKLMGFCNKHGYEFRIEKKSIERLDIQDILESDYYAFRAFQQKAEILVELPISKARTLSGNNFFSLKKHHSVLALAHVIENNSNNVENELFKYYQNVSIPINKEIKNLSDMFGVELSKLKDLPPWLIVYPWGDDKLENMSDFIKRVNISTYVENMKRGIGVSASDGGSQYIFTSENRAKLEAKLISSLYHSFNKKGFDEQENLKDPIGAILYVDNDKYAWMISGGIHRSCVLYAMNQEKITVRLKGIIYKKDLNYWPNMKSGLFTEEEASKIFDRIIQD